MARWKGRGGGGGEPTTEDEDPWEVAGRNPEAKAKLLAARAAGVRDNFTPTPVAPNRFEALAEVEEVEDGGAQDPPGQPPTPFIVGKGGGRVAQADAGKAGEGGPFVEDGGGFAAPNGGYGVGNLFAGADQVNFDAVVSGAGGAYGGNGGDCGGNQGAAGQGEEWEPSIQGGGVAFKEAIGTWILDFLWKAGAQDLGALEDKLWSELGAHAPPQHTQPKPNIPPPESLHKRQNRAWTAFNKVMGQRDALADRLWSCERKLAKLL